ncbi:MAG: hypothetical protein HYU71_06475 [Bacteroidetes bacterium]|nr:hypothetical protein [Bacteroidota bacterium]
MVVLDVQKQNRNRLKDYCMHMTHKNLSLSSARPSQSFAWVRRFVLSCAMAFSLILLGVSHVEAAAITSNVSGNWSATAWPNTTRTGTITTATNSTTVTGSGTSFTTEISVGNIIKTTGGTVIGTVASIQSNTSLTLASNAASANTAIAFASQGVGSGDDVTILNGAFIVVDGVFTCNSVATKDPSNGSSSSTLIVSSSNSLTITGSFTITGNSKGNEAITIMGPGAISAASFTANTVSPSGNTSPATLSVSIKIAQFTVSNNFSVNSAFSTSGSKIINTSCSLDSTVRLTIGGLLSTTLANNTNNLASVSFDIGSGSSTLKLSAASPISVAVANGATSTFILNGTGATVDYTGTAQTVYGTTYNNLTLSGSGIKTISGVTVNGILSLEGTATASAAPTYGTGPPCNTRVLPHRPPGLNL